MIKKLCLCFLFFLPTAKLFAQTLPVTVNYVTDDGRNDPSSVFYNGKRVLNWNDYKAAPDYTSIAAALTSAGFGYSLGFNSANGISTLSIDGFCNFHQNDSWVKPAGKNDYILKHEQHHFDISYICTMDFIKKIQHAALTNANFKSEVKNIYYASIKEMTDMQNLYDDETQHGILKDKQQEWSDKIDMQLQALPDGIKR